MLLTSSKYGGIKEPLLFDIFIFLLRQSKSKPILCFLFRLLRLQHGRKPSREKAFGFDEIDPETLEGKQTRNGWGASIVDSLATMQIMGLDDWFQEGVEFVETIDFTQSKVDQTVSIFETTIRYLGGILSAYELSPRHEKSLVNKAAELGESLSLAWSQGTDVPYGFLNLTAGNREVIIANSNIAEAGTLILEFDQLSYVTGNDTYRQLADASMQAIIKGAVPLPFLPAQGIDPATAEAVGDYVTWGGGSDSFFEYLNKYALLTGDQDVYMAYWRGSVASSIEHLIRTASVGNLTYISDYSKSRGGNLYLFSHLGCFIGGNWLLGAQMVGGDDEIANLALELVNTCHNSYIKTATGIGPERFGFVDKETGSHAGWEPDTANLAFYNRTGLGIVDSAYILRPEVVESYFYAYRVTGDKKYQDWAWDAFQNIKEYCSFNGVVTSLVNVNSGAPGVLPALESFFFAEVMKYFYLIFQDGSTISLDEYVFTTEAQVFPIRNKRDVFDISPDSVSTPSATFSIQSTDAALPAPSGRTSLLHGEPAVPESVQTDSDTPQKRHRMKRNFHRHSF
ncbi:glycoside hydrolase family 47 protein [Atractiella rhizophila]|nr:glycoside hydrolase family 47 protein [Atractiella rhizophila]